MPADYPRLLRAAAVAYRQLDIGGGEHLQLLIEYGDRRIAHALSMERTYRVLGDPDLQAGYTATVDAWLHPDMAEGRPSTYRLGGH